MIPPYESGELWTSFDFPPAPGFKKVGEHVRHNILPVVLYGWVRPTVETTSEEAKVS